jgi:hypothetical protein
MPLRDTDMVVSFVVLFRGASHYRAQPPHLKRDGPQTCYANRDKAVFRRFDEVMTPPVWTARSHPLFVHDERARGALNAPTSCAHPPDKAGLRLPAQRSDDRIGTMGRSAHPIQEAPWTT